MISFPSTPEPVRIGAALAGVAGIIALAGCGTDGSAVADATTGNGDTGTGTSSGSTVTGDEQVTGDGSYADGTYTAEGTYVTPETVETVSVTVTVVDDVVTAVEVTGDPQTRETEDYQGRFIGGISDEVVGKRLDELSVSRVAGSSLTSGGFNQAIEAIRADAAE